MINPFTPTFGVTPPLLVGRDAEIETFRRALANGSGDPARATLLTGARGTGKTVLLNALEDEARRAGWAVVSESAQPRLVDELTKTTLPQLLANCGADATTSRVSGVSASVLGIGGSVSRQVAEQYPVEASFRSELTALALHLDRSGGGVFLSIDEVHRTEQTELRTFFHAIQHAFREGLPVAVAAAGLPSAISSILNDDVLTFLRRAVRWPLGDVADTLVATAVREPIMAAGRTICDDALDLAVKAIQGYPFMIQVVGFELWGVDPAQDVIDLGQAETAVIRAIEQANRLVHEPMLADLSPADRRFLVAMAKEESEPTPIAAIAKRMGVSSGYANKYRARLIAAEAIEPAGRGLVQFTVPFLRDYLRR